MTAIDISRYQGAVDFNAVKASGVSIVIAKMGGGDAGVYVDARWVANRDGIRAAGLTLGSYFFNGPGTSPTAAADFQFANIDWHPGDLVIIDVEGGAIAWSVSQVIEWVNQIIAHGVPASSIGVYMSASVVRYYNWGPVAALGTFLWVASYGANTGQPGTPPQVLHWPAWTFWQYTSNGSVPGVPGRVDVSALAPGFAGGNITPFDNTPEGDLDMPKLIHVTTNPVNPSPIDAIGVGSIFEVDTYGYSALSVLSVANAFAKVDGAFVDVTAEEAIVILQNATARRTRDHIDTPATTAASATDLSPVLAAIAAAVTAIEAHDQTAPATDLAPVLTQLAALEATLTKGYTFNVKPAA